MFSSSKYSTASVKLKPLSSKSKPNTFQQHRKFSLDSIESERIQYSSSITMGRKSSLIDKTSSIEPKIAEHRPSEEVANDNPAPAEFENDTFEIITYSSNDEGFGSDETVENDPNNSTENMQSSPIHMENKEIRTEKDTSDSPVKPKSGYVNATQEYAIDETKISINSDKMENSVSKENTFVGLVATNNKSSDFDNESTSTTTELKKEMNVKYCDGREDCFSSNILVKENNFEQAKQESESDPDFWETNYVAFISEPEEKGPEFVLEN